MIKHRDFELILNDDCGYDAVHKNYEAEHDGSGSWKGSHPIFTGGDVDECIEQIDEWYLDQE